MDLDEPVMADDECECESVPLPPLKLKQPAEEGLSSPSIERLLCGAVSLMQSEPSNLPPKVATADRSDLSHIFKPADTVCVDVDVGIDALVARILV